MSTSLYIFAISSFLNAFCSCILAVLVLKKSKSAYSRILFVFYLSILIWGIGLGSEVISSTKFAALFWAKFLLVGAIFIATTYLHFVLIFVGKIKERRGILLGAYAVAILLVFFNLAGLLIKDVRPIFYFNFYVQPQPYYLCLLGYFGICVIYALFELANEYKYTTVNKKRQIKYFFVSTVIGYIGGSSTFLPKYNISVPPYFYGSFGFSVGHLMELG